MYIFLLILIYIAFISLGLPDSLLGSGWPVMHTELGVPVSYMGIVSMVISGGTIISSLLSDKLTRKFGTRIVTVASVFLTVIALFGFSFSSRFWMLIVFAVPYGLGAGAIDAALNNYIALHYKAKHMSWLHCFWGVGTIVSPFIMSYALANRTWNSGYRMVGLIQLGIALLLLVTLPVWNVNQSTSREGGKSVGLAGALKIKGVPFLLLGFFVVHGLGDVLAGVLRGPLVGQLHGPLGGHRRVRAEQAQLDEGAAGAFHPLRAPGERPAGLARGQTEVEQGGVAVAGFGQLFHRLAVQADDIAGQKQVFCHGQGLLS